MSDLVRFAEDITLTSLAGNGLNFDLSGSKAANCPARWLSVVI
jgi:hypothetical protein